MPSQMSLPKDATDILEYVIMAENLTQKTGPVTIGTTGPRDTKFTVENLPHRHTFKFRCDGFSYTDAYSSNHVIFHQLK